MMFIRNIVKRIVMFKSIQILEKNFKKVFEDEHLSSAKKVQIRYKTKKILKHNWFAEFSVQ